MSYQETYQEWLSADLSEDLHNELLAMDEKTKEDAFYKYLEFGTAGQRGLIGAGTNRMNVYTVRLTTEGLARLMNSWGEAEKKRGVAIAFDSRHFSKTFAFETATILADHGIPSYIYETLRPTPDLSFTIRELHCKAGVMITASHNPAVYNGYKVYGEDGGQMPPEHAAELTDFIRQIDDIFSIHLGDTDQYIKDEMIHIVGEELDKKFLENIKSVTINQDLINQYGRDLSIVYTPLHGTGEMLGRRALKQAGFDKIAVVEEQAVPDPDFSTLKNPNPEFKEAFTLAEKLGRKVGADMLVATDPDADRIGVEVLLPNGEYQPLSGNQIGAILAKYILEAHKQAGTLPANAAIVKSIVSTELVAKIAESYNVEMFNVLTGFKFIGEKITAWEENHEHTYMFGFEESFGYLIKPFVRDKDAIQTMLLVCEVAAYYNSLGKTLYDGIQDIYKEYGYFVEKTLAVTMSGVNGAEEISNLMAKFRASAPKKFAGLEILLTEDFKTGKATANDGKVEKIDMPNSDVLKYHLEDGSWIAVRPSGTEPKIKFYIAVVGDSLAAAEEKRDTIEKEINDFVK